MNIRDNFSRKFFFFSISVSMVLVSLSLFVFAISSIRPAQAAKEDPSSFSTANMMPAVWDDHLRGSIGIGIQKDTAYFVVFGKTGNTFYKADLASARNWYDD